MTGFSRIRKMILGNTVLKLELLQVWILNHVSRSIMWMVNLLFQLQFRAEHSNAINFFSFLALLCCFAVYKARLFVIEGSNPFVKSKHRCVFDRVLHVRLNMCPHYYRQQFPFPIRIVSPKSLLISCAQFFPTLI